MTEPGPELEKQRVTSTDAEVLWDRIAWCRGKPPVEELREARKHREELIPILLEVLRRVDADPACLLDHSGWYGVDGALLLLAEFREPRAFPLVLGLFKRPDTEQVGILAEVDESDIARILASTCGGDRGDLQKLFEDVSVENEAVRFAGLQAMACLAVRGLMPREELGAWIGRKLETLPRVRSWEWDELVITSTDLRFEEHRDAIQRVVREGIVNAEYAADAPDAASDRRYRLIDDAAEEAAEGPWFRPMTYDGGADDDPGGEDPFDSSDEPGDADPLAALDGDLSEEPAVPFVRETPKVGRNDPCPCGSGRKFKKCCGK